MSFRSGELQLLEALLSVKIKIGDPCIGVEHFVVMETVCCCSTKKVIELFGAGNSVHYSVVLQKIELNFSDLLQLFSMDDPELK